MGALVSQAVSVVARLGVADVLAAGPQPVGEIAQRVGAHHSALYRDALSPLPVDRSVRDCQDRGVGV
ncbi:MAG: hypothetical protein ACRDRO_13270 [Pseudonocardiaceae bacterium]